jgi:hypothetical protein
MRSANCSSTQVFPYLAKHLKDASPYPIWQLLCKGICEPEDDSTQEIGERIKRELNGASHDPQR